MTIHQRASRLPAVVQPTASRPLLAGSRRLICPDLRGFEVCPQVIADAALAFFE
jgi:hypothetical protein